VPYKSRKNRRNTIPNRVAVANSTGASENTNLAASVNQPAKNTVSGNTAKSSSGSIPLETHFLNELKWISLVTVIIVILLVAAYYIFR
jgi:hypothetical protein